MPRVLSFINYKGGVGKTTTAYHVGCSLVQHHGQRVLMIDVDPQTNLTFLCRPYEAWKKHKDDHGTVATLYDRYTTHRPLDTESVVWRQALRIGAHYLPDLHLIPCDIELIGQDVVVGRIVGSFATWEEFDRAADQYLHERAFLQRVVESVGDDYDWVLIDCPPNLYPMTQNALCASDFYVVTAIPDHLSTIGLSLLHRKVSDIGRRVSDAARYAKPSWTPRTPSLGAIVFVKVRIGGERTTLQHGDRMAAIRNEFPEETLRAHTTELIGYSEAAARSLPIWEAGTPNALHAARKNEYPDITRELMDRLSGVGGRES